MSTNNHTPIPAGVELNADTINAPLMQLDASIGNLPGDGTLPGATLLAKLLSEHGLRIADAGAEATARMQADAALDERLDAFIGASETSGAEMVDARTAINYGPAPTTLSEALQYSAADIYNVKAYGATGNGATNDEKAIERAITTAAAAAGGVVFFPRGVYIVDSVALKSGLIYRGVGVGATILRKTNSRPTGLVGVLHYDATGSDIKNIVVEDMTIEQNRAVGGGGIFLFTDGVLRNITLQRLYVQCLQDVSGANPLQIGNGTKGAICHNVRILDCHFQAAANSVRGTVACYVTPGARTADHTTQVIVQRCEIEGGRTGFSHRSTGSANVLLFDHNYVHGQTARGAHFYHGVWSRITHNMFSDIIAPPELDKDVDNNDGGAIWFDVFARGPGRGYYRSSVFQGNVIRNVIGNALFAEEATGAPIANNSITEVVKRISPIRAISGNGQVVTVTVDNGMMFLNGSSIRISGTRAYNGDYRITSVNYAANKITFAGTATGTEASGTAASLFKAPDNANTSEGGHAILLTGGCDGAMIQDNRIEAIGGAGIMLCRDFGPHFEMTIAHVHINGNYIRDVGMHGIWLDSHYRQLGGHTRISSNFIGNSSMASAPYAAIYSDATIGSGNVVYVLMNFMSNFYHGYYHTGVSSAAWLMMNWIEANRNGYAIYHPNMVTGAISSNHIAAGSVDFDKLNANTVKYDGYDGYVDEKYGRVDDGSLDANGNFTQVHGLSGTPAYVFVQIEGDSDREAVVQSRDATNIVVRVRNTNGNRYYTGKATFSWYARL